METFKRLKMYYWPYRKVFMWSLLAMLLMTAITVVYPIILQITIDEIVLGRQYQLAAWVSLGFIAVMVLKGMATFFHQYLGDMFGIKSVYRLRNGLYEKLQRLSFSYYDNAKTGDLMSRLTADVEGLRFFLSYGLAEAHSIRPAGSHQPVGYVLLFCSSHACDNSCSAISRGCGIPV